MTASGIERHTKYKEMFLEYLKSNPPIYTPQWMFDLEENDIFVLQNEIPYGHRYIDYNNMAGGVYSSNAPSRLTFDTNEELFVGGQYKLISHCAKPVYINFGGHRIYSPEDFSVTLLETVQLPQFAPDTMYFIALVNDLS